MYILPSIILGLCGSALAAPPRGFHSWWKHNNSHHLRHGYCLSDKDAQQAADIFQSLIQNYSNETALATLTPDFVDYSSAVNIIINRGTDSPKSLEGPTFSSRQEFMSAQGSQPRIPFKQLNLFHGCDSVSLRWVTRRSANGQETEVNDLPVVGNAIIETVKAGLGDKYNFRIKTLFSEFNAAAWLINLGEWLSAHYTSVFTNEACA